VVELVQNVRDYTSENLNENFYVCHGLYLEVATGILDRLVVELDQNVRDYSI
jgi:hypothetical protein